MATWRGEHPDPKFVAALLSPLAGAKSDGNLRWAHDSTSSQYRGSLVVVAPGLVDDGRLEISVSRLRPEAPCLVYLADGAFVRRLCVNKPHRPFAGTHKHRIETYGPAECYEPDDIPDLPIAPDVSPHLYRGIIEAFAAECSIAIAEDFGWSAPWEV